VIKLFFETCDVGIMSNNIESKFGISALHDKMIVCAPEVRNDLKLDQAEFQSMVSGEEISVAVKHQNAFTIEWKVPMVMAGNEIPNWADASGSIQRRLVVFDFGVPVTAGDMKLDAKLYSELPRIIRKANKAYLEAVSKHASENIWKILPDYFAGTREAIARSTNFVENFLASEHVIFGPDLVVPFADFKSALKDYAITNGLMTKSFTSETFHGPFARKNIKVLDQQSMEYNGRKMNTVFLRGISFKPVEVDADQCLL
jgi:phage/plasmid-associated DNA primase